MRRRFWFHIIVFFLLFYFVGNIRVYGGVLEISEFRFVPSYTYFDSIKHLNDSESSYASIMQVRYDGSVDLLNGLGSPKSKEIIIPEGGGVACDSAYYTYEDVYKRPHTLWFYKSTDTTFEELDHDGVSVRYIHHVVVNIRERQYTYADKVIERCGTYYWPKNGQAYTSSTVAAVCDDESSCSGCQLLRLTILPYPRIDSVVYICDCRNSSSTKGCSFTYERKNALPGQPRIVSFSRETIFYDIDRLRGSRDGECDTIVDLTVKYRNNVSYGTAYYCSGQSFEWNGMTYTGTEDLNLTYKTLTSDGKCDSIANMTFKVQKYTYRDVIGYVCPGDSFSWYGEKYPISKNRTDYKYKPVEFHESGCPKVIERLLVLPYDIRIGEREQVTVCYGGSYLWHSKRCFVPEGKRSVVYRDTIRSVVTGCDSVCILDLSTLPEIAFETTANICEGEEFIWTGHFTSSGVERRYIQEGVYYDTIKYKSPSCTNCSRPCDSIIRLTLIERHASIDTQIFHGCSNTQFYIIPNDTDGNPTKDETQWIPFRATQDTVFDYILSNHITGVKYNNQYGCDTGYHVIAYVVKSKKDAWGNIIPAYEDSITLVKAPNYKGDSQWYSVFIDTCGDFTQHFRSTAGCDSFVLMHVGIITTDDSVWEAHACATETYHWFPNTPLHRSYGVRNTLSRDTIIVDSIVLKNQHNLDSTLVLVLHFHPVYSTLNHRVIQKRDTLCSGDTIRINGLTITKGGRYIINMKTRWGCDSIINYEIFGCNRFDTTIIDSMCWTQRYTDFGFDVDTFGDFVQYNKNYCGCDSIYRLHISEITNSVYTIDTACENEPYQFNDMVLTRSGHYLDTQFLECKTFYELDLTVIPMAEFYVAPMVECADVSMLHFDFDYVSITSPTSYSIILSDTAHQAGLQDVERKRIYNSDKYLELPLPSFGNTYVRPDYYNGVAHIWNDFCDSVSAPVKILLKYPSSIIKQMWNDMLLVKDRQYNGGFDFSAYEWYCDGKKIEGETEPYIYYVHSLVMGKEYEVRLTRISDGKTLSSCAFVPEDKVEWVVPKDPYITVNPTWVKRSNPTVSVKTNTDGEYMIFDMTGKRLGGGTFAPCEHNEMSISIPTTYPFCLIHFHTKDGVVQIEKIYIQ